MKTDFVFRFSKTYFVLAAALFVIEVLIALFVSDRFIRPYFGDVLVVILIYCFIKAFFKLRTLPLAIGVLLFAFMIEFLQYIRLVEILGMEKSKIISTVLGTSFAWNDILAYIGGFIVILVTEKVFQKSSK
jgi:hypothetical protein